MISGAWHHVYRGLRDGLPIGLGYLSVSFTFGMMAVQTGLPVWGALLISMTNLTSAGQFAGLGVMAAGGPLAEMALTQLVINARYALMSLSLSQKLAPGIGVGSRLVMAFGNTDEIFAVAMSQPETVGRRYWFGLMILPYVGWSLGTLIGAAAYDLLPAALRSALGIAIYGMFLAILLPPAKRSRAICIVIAVAALVSMALHAVSCISLSDGTILIVAAVVAAAVGALIRPVDVEEVSV